MKAPEAEPTNPARARKQSSSVVTELGGSHEMQTESASARVRIKCTAVDANDPLLAFVVAVSCLFTQGALTVSKAG